MMMTPLKWYGIAFLFLFFSFDGFGQEEVSKGTLNYTIADTAIALLYLDSCQMNLDSTQYDQALVYGEKALDIYKQISDLPDNYTAEAYYRIGITLEKKRELKQAIINFQKALDIRLKVYGKEHTSIADLYSRLGMAYKNTGKFKSSLKANKEALDIRLKTYGKEHPDVGVSYSNTGIAYAILGDFDKSLINLHEALETQIKIYGEENQDVASSYNNLGLVYYKAGDFNNSLKYSQKALGVKLKIYEENHASLASTYNNIGLAYYKTGDYDRTIVYYQKVLNISLKVFGKQSPQVASTYNNIGLIYYQTENYPLALSYFQKALDIEKKTNKEGSRNLSLYYGNIGKSYNGKGEFDKAISNHQMALDIELKLYGSEHPNVASSYSHIGSVYYNTGNYDKALQYYQKALDIELKFYGEENSFLAPVYAEIGNLYYGKSEFDKARSYYQKALDIQLKIYGQAHSDVAISYNKLGEICFQKKEYNKSSEFFDNAIISLELLRKKFSSSISTQYLLSESHAIFLNSVRNLVETSSNDSKQPDQTQAFTYAEKAKSYLLLEALNNSRAKGFAGIPDSMLNKEHDLKVNLTFFDKRRQDKLSEGLHETDSIVLDLTNQLFQVQHQLENYISKLEKEYPKYYQAKYDYSTTSVETVQNNLLENDHSIVEYFVGDSSIYIFLVQKDTFEIHEVKHDFPLDDWVREMTIDGIYGYHSIPQNMRTSDLEESTVSNYTNAAQQLYKKLIAPVAEQLTEDLIIIPDGVLGYVPFEALLTAAPKREGAFKTYPYLLKKHQISYCYSATLLQEMQQKQHRQKASNQLLAMAPFFQDDVKEMISRLDTTDLLASVSLRDSLGALKGSGEEIARINDLWKGTSVYGADATLETFQQKAADYQILHLSTHGKADDRVGDYAYLAFGVPGDKGTFDKLYARDLYNYSLNADMVVLSACETGIGKLQKGEGIVSLARAFAYAGAKSIFSTLWKVDDVKTKDLMVYFYANLKKGETKDEALRNAKLKYLEKNKRNGEAMHPFFWAGLIGIGDMSAVTFKD
jgi:CHAT domain-containing protein/Tfp pilus assembly protein PilF